MLENPCAVCGLPLLLGKPILAAAALQIRLLYAEVAHALACPAAERSSPRAASRHDGDGKLKRTPPICVDTLGRLWPRPAVIC